MSEASLVDRGMPLAVAVDLLNAIAEIADDLRPQAIVLFGSYATGEAREDSDLDLMIIAETDDRWRLAGRLYRHWHELRGRLEHLPPADILVYSPAQFAEAQVVGFPAWQAAREGVVVYGRLPEPSGTVAG
ncbi:MAG: nucleotidyltransferase domain-containing protein [Armatimonadota bacterium]|nr:nucleotidyltransferase domain-containing protein [Armatimonadota bacterium]